MNTHRVLRIVIGVIVLGIAVSCAAVGVVLWEIHDSVQDKQWGSTSNTMGPPGWATPSSIFVADIYQNWGDSGSTA